MTAGTRRIVQSSAWVSLHTGLYRLVTLAIAVLAARLLDVEDYGKISVLQSTSALFIMFATMGLGTVATKLVAQHGKTYIRAISIFNMMFCACAALIVFVCKSAIAEGIYQDPSLSPLLGGLALYIFASGVTQVQSGILAGKEAYRTISKINLWVGLVGIAVVFFGISAFGIEGWIFALIAVEWLKACVFQLSIHSEFKQAVRQQHNGLKTVLKPAVPIALSGFFILPVNWFLVRELLLAAGYLDVALLNITDQWIAILTFFPIAIGNAMLPIMAKSQGDLARQTMSTLALKINLGLALVTAIPVVALADVILLLYGTDYTGNGKLFWLVVPLVAALALTNQLNNRVIAEDNANAMLVSNGIWMCVCFPIAYVLIALNYGIVGLLLGRIIGYLVKLLYLLYVLSKNKNDNKTALHH